MPPRAGEPSSERCLLQALIAAPPEGLTRAELQERTGLSPATLVTHLKVGAAGELVGRLAALVEMSEDEARVARYQLRADSAYVLGLDLGRSHIQTGVGDALGHILTDPDSGERWEERVDRVQVDEDPWGALDIAADLAAKLIHDVEDRGPIERTRFAGIGVSVTSAIEPDTGMFRQGWSPGRTPDGWEGIRVVKELKERLERRGLTCPLVIDKDANHGAVAHGRSQRGRNVKNFIFVKWAHGLSAGLVLGRLQRGYGGSAGAFGHSPLVHVLDKQSDEPSPSSLWVPEPDWRCRRCGKQDCLEAMIGTDRLRWVVASKRGLSRDDGSQWPTLEEIQRAALENRKSHEGKVLRAAAKRLGNALGTVANLLNPQTIVVGGLFSRAHAELLNDRIRQGLRDVSIAPVYRDLDLQFADTGVIDGTIASVITSERMVPFLLRSIRD